MGFSKEWDECYVKNTQMSIWPWSDLIGYVMRYARPDSAEFKVLELGCGAGANIPFFRTLGVDYYTVEGSATAVELLKEKYTELSNNLVAGDFTKEIPFNETFDLVIDRSSLTHNDTAAIKTTLALVCEKLKPGAKFIGIDWFSTTHTEFTLGEKADDEYTRRNYSEGQFAHVGRVHFSDRDHLQQLFAGFEIERMEHKIVRREIPDDKYTFASWNFVARKKG